MLEMLRDLREIYPSILLYENFKPEGFIWFSVDNNDWVGIDENDLTDKDYALLSIFLKQYNPDQSVPQLKSKAKQWYNRIYQTTNDTEKIPFRFVYFSLPENKIEPESWQEVLNELFNATVPILWNSKNEGVLIETINFIDSEVNYKQFINILIDDLLMKIRFYVGEIQNSYIKIKTNYETIIKDAKIVFSVTNKEVVSYSEGIALILIHNLSIEDKEKIASSILKDFIDDLEMLNTLNIFLNSNLNISETAKKIYMHRNSVQYRIDKYINETGIDIRNFNEAIAVRLALLVITD